MFLVVLLSVLLCGYAWTTHWATSIVDRTDLVCDDLLVSASRQGVLSSHLSAAIRGAHVMKVQVTEDFCIMFAWSTVITIWSGLVAAVQGF